MKKISFIGLGNMGLEMAKNLSKSNYEVIGFDIDQHMYKQLEENNIKCVSSIEHALNNPDVVITMLPDGKIVKSVWEKILSILTNKPLAIDCSTIDIENASIFHDLAKKQNLRSLDAPVSGGVIGANNGSLTFMVGGNVDDYNEAKSLFDIMGNKSVLCGLATSGQAIKICNNMLLAVTMVGVSESFNLAENLNVNIQKLFEVISTSSGSCWAVNNYCPIKGVGPSSPADNDYKGGFASKLMHKDLSLAIAAATDSNSKVNFTKQTFDIFSKIIENKSGEKDFSFIKQYIK
jgi:3-hydroxyisobutyrate dehydrogenase